MFRKAEKRQAKLRLALCGPSGSGKTLSALHIAQGLAPNGRIAVVGADHVLPVIDTGYGTCELFAIEPEFDRDQYSDLIKNLSVSNFDVLIIRDISSAWDDIPVSSEKNFLTKIKTIKARVNAIFDAILGSKIHIIMTVERHLEVTKSPILNYMENDLKQFCDVYFVSFGSHRAFFSVKDRTGFFESEFLLPDAYMGQMISRWLPTREITIRLDSEGYMQ